MYKSYLYTHSTCKAYQVPDLCTANEKPKSVIAPDKISRWQHNILRSYTDFLKISNLPLVQDCAGIIMFDKIKGRCMVLTNQESIFDFLFSYR